MVNKRYQIEIEKLKFLISENKLIGNELIKYIDDNEFIDYIHNKSEEIIKNSMDVSISNIQDYYEVIISLSMIALQYYDGNFWSHVQEIYGELYDRYSDQKIRGKINDILGKYKNEDLKRYINYPIMNAIVPIKFLSNYFEFMYDIYKVNFQKSLPDNIEDELKYVFNGLNSYIKEDQDDLDLAVTNKTYKLIKTTQSIIKKSNNLEELIQLSAKVIRYIDNFYWNDTSKKLEENSYFNEGLNIWKTQTEDKEQIRYLGERKEREFTSKWKPRFKLKDEKIYLITPIHRVPKDVDPRKINIFVYNGDEPISLEEEPIVQEVIGGYIVEPKNIVLDKPIGKLTYVLSDGTNEIYNSKDSLYRNIIAFNKDGNELKNNTPYDDIVIFASDKLDNPKIDIFKNSEYYKLGSLLVNIGDSLLINNNIFIFDNFSKPGIIGEQKNGAKVYIDDKELPVYSNVHSLVFETERKIENLAIEVNNHRYKINDDIDFKQFKDGLINNITIEIGDMNASGYFYIKVFDFIENVTICKYDFFIDKKLFWTCEEIKKDEYMILVDSSLIITDNENNETNEFYIDIKEKTEADIYLKLGNGKEARYILDLPIQFYKIDDSKWIEIHNYIWYYDIGYNSKLYFKNIVFDSVELMNRDNYSILKFQIDNKNNSIDISVLKNYKNEKGLRLIVKKSDLEISSIQILNECKYIEEKSNITFDPQEDILEIKTEYVGKNTIILKIENEEDKVFFSKEINKNISTTKLKVYQTFKNYTIKFYEHKQELLNSETLIYQEKIKCYSYKDFIHRYFNISKIYYGYDLDNLNEMNLWSTFIYIDDRIGNTTYVGRVYQMKDNKQNYMDKVNPVKMELTTTINGNQMNAMITVLEGELEGAGLLIDNVNKTIYNGDNPNLQDIYEYEILLEKRKKY